MSLEGWHELPDGRDGLYRDGICLASIETDPGGDPPYATQSWSPEGVRSLRNLATFAAARAHCERVVGPSAREDHEDHS